jgi:hypothetical protein
MWSSPSSAWCTRMTLYFEWIPIFCYMPVQSKIITWFRQWSCA